MPGYRTPRPNARNRLLNNASPAPSPDEGGPLRGMFKKILAKRFPQGVAPGEPPPPSRPPASREPGPARRPPTMGIEPPNVLRRPKGKTPKGTPMRPTGSTYPLKKKRKI